MGLEDILREIKKGVVDIITEENLKEKLSESRPLNIKFGVDPTAPDIHLGHTVPLQKLRQFQKYGHNAYLIIGDFTARIGDPSGRSKTRPMISKEEIEKNIKTYEEQIYKILNPGRTVILYNSSWLEKFSSMDFLELGSRYTVQQMLQRRDFNERVRKNIPLSISELMYPLLVGYDSVHIKADIEIGGTDQLFNFIISRELQKSYNQKPEVVMTLPILKGIDGKEKMSKSLGNAIGINEDPYEIYGKIMSISDELMIEYYELLSDISIDELQEIRNAVKEGSANPMIYKQRLAKEIVSKYHGVESASLAEKKFEEIHIKRKLPSINKLEETIINPEKRKITLIELIRLSGKAKTNSEARRLIEQGAVRINGKKINDIYYDFEPQNGQILQIGKKYFRRLKHI